MAFSKNECLDALKQAYESIGRSPTIEDYRSLDLSPSSPSTIVEKFGSWNEAKREAGLSCYEQNHRIESKPEGVELPDETSWQELSSYQRYYYKNREKEKERTLRRTRKLKKWFRRYKRNFECVKCGEDHPACIDFHHEDEKEVSVSNLVSRKNPSKDRIKKEIKKCEVLCANCHRKHHSEER